MRRCRGLVMLVKKSPTWMGHIQCSYLIKTYPEAGLRIDSVEIAERYH